MQNLIAAKTSCYGQFVDRAWTHLPQIGIHHMEISVPAPDGVEALKRKLADHGLSASSLQGDCPIGRADVVAVLEPQFEACQALGTRLLFVSVHAGDLDLNVAYERLRQVGDAAAKHQVTVIMESHPDLVTNGDVGLRTMQGVAHAHIRVNFDTANVYYYNHDVTATGELAKVIDYVAGVHVKDSGGGYKAHDFPTLGQGVVDFAAVFAQLNARGFTGPFTIELEGQAGVTLDEAGQLKYVADSVDHLKSIGAMS